jgi:hypothetical protein
LFWGTTITAVQNQKDRFSTAYQGLQGIELNPADVGIQHKQHKIGLHGYPRCQSRTRRCCNLIDSWRVDEFDSVQTGYGDRPRQRLLLSGAAVSYISGQELLADQGINEA